VFLNIEFLYFEIDGLSAVLV